MRVKATDRHHKYSPYWKYANRDNALFWKSVRPKKYINNEND